MAKTLEARRVEQAVRVSVRQQIPGRICGVRAMHDTECKRRRLARLICPKSGYVQYNNGNPTRDALVCVMNKTSRGCRALLPHCRSTLLKLAELRPDIGNRPRTARSCSSPRCNRPSPCQRPRPSRPEYRQLAALTPWQWSAPSRLFATIQSFAQGGRSSSSPADQKRPRLQLCAQ